MNKRIRTFPVPVPAHQGQGRRPRYGLPMSQTSIGLDAIRLEQLRLLTEHYAEQSVSDVTKSDILRKAFDEFVVSHLEEVPGLKGLPTPA